MARKGKILKLAPRNVSGTSAELAEAWDNALQEEDDWELDDLDDGDLGEDLDTYDYDSEDLGEGYVDEDDLYGYEADYRRRRRAGSGKKKKARPKASKAARVVLAVSICVMVASMGALGYYIYDRGVQAELLGEMLSALEINTFYEGITVDGVDVSGMTLAQAKNRWREEMETARNAFGLVIRADNEEFVVDADMAGLSFNNDEVLEQAFYFNREGKVGDRYRHLTQLSEEGRAFTTSMQYDLLPVRDQIVAFCAKFEKDAVDAEVTGFDFEEKTFTIKPEKAGRVPKIADAANAAISMLENGEYGEAVKLEFTPTPAAVTKGYLEGSLGEISSFKTKTTSDSSRNTNIKLASSAIRGTVLQPGEVFSFNDTTGERTRDKGYKAAGAINDGVMVDETGGGVCQVSSTLFNAVVRADLEIVKRSPHSWPSSYVNPGEDAAVDWPYTDFQFRNNTDAAIYIWMRYSDRYVTAEIYGIKLEDGITIGLDSEKTWSGSPGSPKVKVNKSWPEGKVRTIRKARNGSAYTTYKIYYKDGEEISREKFYKTDYHAIKGSYEVGPNTKVK